MNTDGGRRNRALLAWYATFRRDLPWRGTSDPWAILVSEVMAQQTQISRVAPAWKAFLQRFPDPATMAESPLADVIEQWGGLGYLRRARHLHQAAKVITEHGWPTEPDELRRLPGVGAYTANAVACFAFGHAVPAVDVNLQRVLSRWAGEPLAGRGLTEIAAESLDRSDPAAWNQAIMDLAATVCSRSKPACSDCPVSKWCADPSVTVAAVRQSPFAGSRRQARAAVVKSLAATGTAKREEITAGLDLEPETIEEAIAALVAEGTVADRGGVLSLSG